METKYLNKPVTWIRINDKSKLRFVQFFKSTQNKTDNSGLKISASTAVMFHY